MSFTLKLDKPIKSHKGDLSEITFREPKGGDLFDLGEPFTVESTFTGSRRDPDKATVIVRELRNIEVCRLYLERLSGLDRGALGDVPADKIMETIDWLVKSFKGLDSPLPAPPASS